VSSLQGAQRKSGAHQPRQRHPATQAADAQRKVRAVLVLKALLKCVAHVVVKELNERLACDWLRHQSKPHTQARETLGRQRVQRPQQHTRIDASRHALRLRRQGFNQASKTRALRLPCECVRRKLAARLACVRQALRQRLRCVLQTPRRCEDAIARRTVEGRDAEFLS